MVKKLLVFISVLFMVSVVAGQISLQVYESDGETPFDCNEEIMVGTKLALVVNSDSNDYWGGGLFIDGNDRTLGILSGRGYDPNTRYYTDSYFEAAGDFAKVTAWKDSLIWGFDLYTFYPVDGNSEDDTTEAGDWFIIDYEANDIGGCNVGFYDYSVDWNEPNFVISFSHVPTRDMDSDGNVNFEDYSLFAEQWGASDCNEPNWCDGADFDLDGYVDWYDLGLFVDYWLWPDAGPDSNDSNDFNVIFRILDINDSNEITIDVNDSITLYITMETNDVNVFVFEFEVNISDTNLGSIDNTDIDANDPPGDGTARILATPRDTFFDYWGPGWEQTEGIHFSGASLSSPISDGNMASFEFTCEGQGNVTLDLICDLPAMSKTEGIVIHQSDPNS